MKIAVLSGKGGTGKTLISVNLAAVAENSTYIDCDVEEPNGHLFFKPNEIREEEVAVPVPKVDENLCSGCRKCVEFCKFGALAYAGSKLIIFEEICHSCGGCVLVCPEGALAETDRVIGKIEKGISGKTSVYTGILNIGEPSGVQIINKLYEVNKVDDKNSLVDNITIIDCPPGSACTTMESIKESDYCILVAEPTLFGVHNLNMVFELVQLFRKPFGVIVNKYIDDDNPVDKFCLDKCIKILGRIPFDKEIGRLNSNAKILVRERNEYKKYFTSLLQRVVREVQNEAALNS